MPSVATRNSPTIAALTARGSATFSPVKKNGNSDTQITLRAMAPLARPHHARHVDQPLVDAAHAGKHRDEHDVEHEQREDDDLGPVADGEPANETGRQS